MITTTEALLSGLPPVAYDPNAPGVAAEAATMAVVLDKALNSDQRILIEQDPAQAAETLADWERNYGLPDQCSPIDLVLAQRTGLLLRKIASTGGQSRPYMIATALAAGYAITIDEFDPQTVESDVEYSLHDLDAPFMWQINVPLPGGALYSVESGVDEPLETGTNYLIECLLNQIKPAHTLILFNYL
jgi:uncharacterized protein YmfQ (DUF2313 family)